MDRLPLFALDVGPAPQGAGGLKLFIRMPQTKGYVPPRKGRVD